MVTNCGAELFTGNTMMLTCALIEKKATWGQLLKNWSVSYFGECYTVAAAAAAAAAAVMQTSCRTTF